MNPPPTFTPVPTFTPTATPLPPTPAQVPPMLTQVPPTATPVPYPTPNPSNVEAGVAFSPAHGSEIAEGEIFMSVTFPTSMTVTGWLLNKQGEPRSSLDPAALVTQDDKTFVHVITLSNGQWTHTVTAKDSSGNTVGSLSSTFTVTNPN